MKLRKIFWILLKSIAKKFKAEKLKFTKSYYESINFEKNLIVSLEKMILPWSIKIYFSQEFKPNSPCSSFTPFYKTYFYPFNPLNPFMLLLNLFFLKLSQPDYLLPEYFLKIKNKIITNKKFEISLALDSLIPKIPYNYFNLNFYYLSPYLTILNIMT